MSNLLPISIAYAAVDATAFGNIVNPIIKNIVYPVIGIVFGLAVLLFVYGVLQMVFWGEDAKARENGKNTIIWGSIGMAIMVSAWGIIYFVSNTVIDLAK
jgi:large-conductance mechanosensitive channel